MLAVVVVDDVDQSHRLLAAMAILGCFSLGVYLCKVLVTRLLSFSNLVIRLDMR